MTHEITEHLFLGWLLVDLDWSWQNPAHDQFPCTYQLFYRSKVNSVISISLSIFVRFLFTCFPGKMFRFFPLAFEKNHWAMLFNWRVQYFKYCGPGPSSLYVYVTSNGVQLDFKIETSKGIFSCLNMIIKTPLVNSILVSRLRSTELINLICRNKHDY